MTGAGGGYFDAPPRPVAPGDASGIRALVLASLGVTPYIDREMELVSLAERGDPEVRSLVIERDGTVAALALFGPVAGTQDTWKLYSLLLAERVEPRQVGAAMVDAVIANVRSERGRLLVAELPADPAIGKTLTLLRARGFKQEGRIPDFFRDEVALLFLRRDM
jgi:hypothetical protein